MKNQQAVGISLGINKKRRNRWKLIKLRKDF